MSAGRPSDYRQEYNEQMLEMFLNWPTHREISKEIASGGRKVVITESLVNYPPTLNKFSIKIGTDRNTLKRWADENPEFRSTYTRCKAIQEEWLSDRGTTGEYNPGFTKLMLVNHSDIKDKITHEVDDDTKKALKLAYRIDPK
jgi:hypothetical protein